ncbi:2-hydroxyglutaryl-CoA dehydratase activator [Desulfomarina profundi]|uniref:2-hydroxyglutaryl-CoA dehydratase activator n=1 Tax=Desulfomarina profundi TaxID=2772557 RepID=A0A8D5JNH0_9BACT|nr:acyl-CoA dehydratase activase [Desulfomarina profundi]BCL60125.1 2-hydroxyglutaryl-CoA dehydratase activator [Desulfomarina profundi]
MTKMYLGVDAGSISLDAAIIDQLGRTVAKTVVLTRGQTNRALKKALLEFDEKHPDCSLAGVCITGSGRTLIAETLQTVSVNEITAHAMGTAPLLPENTVCSLLEIGGQDSKFITLKRQNQIVEVLDHSMNSLCAAGTGTFFDGQASRLGISVAELGELAQKAKKAAHVAGRCVVFSKTDIIHHQQSGTRSDELALGLCESAVRNIIGTLIHGRTIHPPLFFTGGVAANRGMCRALLTVLNLHKDQLIVPPDHRLLGAIGAALRARKEETENSPKTIRELLARLTPAETPSCSPGSFTTGPNVILSPSRPSSTRTGQTVDLGFDLGSVSIKWAIVSNESILDEYYAFTRGQPLKALAHALAELRKSPAFADRKVSTVGVTGSGRKLAARLLHADISVNEITAHTTAMRMLNPEVDTLFEIGGQDAKFVRFEGNQIKEFALNTACSAGTGSLLLEESKRLGLDVKELDHMASMTDRAADLQDRCTVFIDSDLVARMQQGVSIEELSRGLLHAVARNYIEKVVGHRKTGSHIVFAGGVSRSHVITQELERLTGKKVTASPWGPFSGAIGAALVAGRSTLPEKEHDLFNLAIPQNLKKSRLFTCKGCGGSCSVRQLEFDDLKFYTGDGCGRWSGKDNEPSDSTTEICRPRNLLDKRIQLWGLDEKNTPLCSQTIGIPRAHQTWDMFPFLKTFFDELGLKIALSPPSTPSSVQHGVTLSRAEQCLPVKIALSHVDMILQKGARALFIPVFGEMEQDPNLEDPVAKRLINCIYSLQLGSVIRATFEKKVNKHRLPLLHPSIPMNPEREKLAVQSLHKALKPLGNFSRSQIRSAFRKGKTSLQAIKEQSAQLGLETLKNTTPEKPVVVLFGRSYTLYDPVLNIQISRRLERLGLTPVPYDTILANSTVPPELSHMQWRTGTEHIRAAAAIKSVTDAYPLFLSYYGCGPDAFIAKSLRQVLGDRLSLQIELDGHSGEAGLETRLEAFADAIFSTSSRKTDRRIKKQNIPLRCPERLKGRTIAMPYFADHVHAFAGALERAEMSVIMMEPATEETRILGEQYCDGGECSPYAMILGDLVKWALDDSLPQDRKGFFITSAKGPCLLAHYAHAFSRVLTDLGAHELLLWNPYGSELPGVMSLSDLMELWRGIVACDYFWRWSVALHPYAREKDDLAKAKEQALHWIRTGVREGSVYENIKKGISIMKAVPVDLSTSKKRFKVGIVGDIYTRVNPLANQGLYDRLEELGCQVLAPPFMLDGQLYDAWTDPIQDFYSRRFGTALKRTVQSAVQLREAARIRRLFPDNPEISFDGTGLDWFRETSLYCNNQSDGYLAQNLGKTLDFIKMGADGILSVMCHNCMVGLTSDALFPKIRANHNNIPIASISYDSIGDTHITTRLEAFVELLRARRKGESAKET